MNIYKNYGLEYLKAGYSVIPDKYMSKQPAIKGWNDYCYRLPSEDEVQAWSSHFTESNIALCLGESSGVIVLDVDTDDKRILDIIMPVLPPSPVEKKGSKGFTRFFRYKGEITEVFKYNGEVIFEVLSTNKKTTIPPSIHPNGVEYTWVDKSLLDIKVDELPLLPPFLVSHISDKIRSIIPDTSMTSRGRVISGRNNVLSSYCGELIKQGVPVDTAIKNLIDKDKAEHEVPLFSDPEEMMHTEVFTNALTFYTGHLNTINSRHFKKNEEYEIPITASAVDLTKAEDVRLGKLQKQGSQKNAPCAESLDARNALLTCLCCGGLND